MKKLFAIVMALALCAAVTAVAGAETYTLTYSTPLSQEQSSTIYFDKALDLITERTGGAVTFTRTYSGTLGGEHELGVMCTSGDLDIVCVGPGQWSDWDEAFKVFDCPFLFTSFEHFDRVLASEDYQAWLDKHGEAMNLKFVMTFNQAFKGILNKQRDVISAADLKGLKLRVPDSASLIEIGNAMGYTATPTAAADQYMSLSQGIVDGADHALWAHQSWKLTEIAKHFSDTRHALQCVFFAMNKETLDSLPSEYQQIMLDTFAEVQAELSAKTREDAEESYAQAEKDGVKVIPHEKLDIESFEAALSGIEKTYSALDPELVEIIKSCADAE